MIQLGYYSTTQPPNQDESIDFDPNYDPSDFLMKKDPSAHSEEHLQQIQQQYQESYEYSGQMQEAADNELQQQQNYYGTFAQQSFNVSDFGFQQPQQIAQEDYSQQQVQQQLVMPNDGGGLADLEISDSDDEGEQTTDEINTSQSQADTSKDDDYGLYF